MSGPAQHGGALDHAIERFGARREDWLDLSTGINPEGVAVPVLPDEAWQRLPGTDLLERVLEKARRFYGVPDAAAIVAAPGTQSLIQILPEAASQAGRADIVAPTYSEYSASFSRLGWQPCEIAGTDAISAEAKIVVIVNPNNPDGRITGLETIDGVARELAQNGGAVIVDEAFQEASMAESSAGLVPGGGVVVLKSFGKFFGLAGMRLGFAIASPEIAARLAERLGPWAVSGPALAVADHVLGDAAAIQDMRTRIEESAKSLETVLEEAGLATVGETGLFRLVERENAAALYDALCRRRILVRRFDYRGDWLRFGLAPHAAYARLREALSGALADIAG